MQIRPTKQWGSCHTSAANTTGDIPTLEINQCKLDITNGLHLEMYNPDAHEIYYIKYDCIANIS